MPDLDLSEPLPDRAHEAIRVAVLQAIEDARLNVGDIQSTLGMMDMLFTFIGELLDQLSAVNVRDDADEIRDNTAQADIDALQTTVADLTTRVAALENPNP